MLSDSGDEVLLSLLIFSIILGILLTFISTAAVGRTLTDLERQIERHIEGRARIQVWVNLRMSLNRVAFGAVFVLINIMLLVDAPVIWRMWTNRTLWTGLLLSFLTAAWLDWLAERELIRLSMRELEVSRLVQDTLATEAVQRREEDLQAGQESYKQMAVTAIANLEEAAVVAAAARGEQAVKPLVPVVPEHSSPTTAQQKATAEIQTWRARLTAATLVLRLPPRDKESE